jgi:OOP family OmpA-OmpF porin
MTMESFQNFTGPLVVGALVVASLSPGCASKKYVRNQVAPIDQRVTQVNQAATQNKEAISKLGDKEETDISRVNEQAMSAQNAAKDAANAAQQADQKAGQAQTMARNVGDRLTQVHQTVENQLENVDNYKLVSTEKVLFGFDSATLTKEDKEKLDAAVQSMGNAPHYLIEVAGFTDSTGNNSYNLALSKRRADAVVRYLLVQHQVPLYRIHVVGLGEEEPAANNRTRAGRQENRRVEIRAYAANWSGQPGQAQGQMQQNQTSHSQAPATTAEAQTQTKTKQAQTPPGQMTMPSQMPAQPGQVQVQTQPQPPAQMPMQPNPNTPPPEQHKTSEDRIVCPTGRRQSCRFCLY